MAHLGLSKQSAESKQTAELIKMSKFSFQTSLLWALSALEVFKWIIWVLLTDSLSHKVRSRPASAERPVKIPSSCGRQRWKLQEGRGRQQRDGCTTAQEASLARVRKGSRKFMGKSIWVDGLSQWMGRDGMGWVAASAGVNAFWSNVHTPHRISCRPTDTREAI